MNDDTKELLALLVIAGIILSAVLMISPWRPYKIVDAGERGVEMHFGEVQDKVHGEGLVTFLPFVTKVKIIDVRTKTLKLESEAVSKDMQKAATSVAVNYIIDPRTANIFYQEIGYDCSKKKGCSYERDIMTPAILDITKTSTAKFTAPELTSNREEVKMMIESDIKAEMKKIGIDVRTVSVTNFVFGDDYMKSIEDKVVAKELAKKAEIDLERVEFEAKQKFAEAEGDAKAIAVIQEQLEVSDGYIEYLKITKWNGELPKVTGGATPFMDISGIAGTAATG